MSDSNSIFDASQATPENNNSGAANTTTSGNDTLGTLLASIKNDRGEPKYKNAEAALEALSHSQNYIPQLKNDLEAKSRELEEAREQLNKMKSMEDVIARLTQAKDEPSTPGTLISDEDIARIVERQMTASKAQDTIKANQRKVSEVLIQSFGNEKAGEVFYNKAKELGFSAEDINSLAGKNPEAVLRMIGVSGTSANKQGTTLPSGTYRSDAFKEKANSTIGRETIKLQIGATTQDHAQLMQNARAMVEELNEHGYDIGHLTDPKNFFKYMK